MAISVLLVDDHPIVLKGLSRLFDLEADMEVVATCRSVDAAVEKVREQKPDVVLADLNLMGDSGLRLIRIIRDHNFQSRCLILSVYEEAVFASRAIDAGANGYLNKTRPAETIMAAVRQVARGEDFYGPGVLEKHRRTRSDEKQHGGEPDELLSPRELEVFQRLGAGLTAQQIADEMFISTATAYKHIQNIKNKLLVPTSRRLGQVAVEWAIRSSHLPPPHERHEHS